jgi:hypothetical protein
MDSRRYFLKKLIGIPIVGVFFTKKAVAASKKDEYFINQFYVAGFQFYEGPGILGEMNVGDELSMKAAPDNPHDHYAVELYFKNSKIGHIPRTDNKHISRLLRQEFPMICRIKNIQANEPTWQQLKVAVWIINEHKVQQV